MIGPSLLALAPVADGDATLAAATGDRYLTSDGVIG